MAEALARQLLTRADLAAASVGTLGWNGHPATPHAVRVMSERGIDMSGHISRRMTADDVAAADLIVAMTRKHAWAVAAHDEAAYERTFLLGELVRAATESPPRGDLRRWATALGRLRGDAPIGHAQDEVADPAGESLEVYRNTADLLEARLAALVPLLARQ